MSDENIYDDYTKYKQFEEGVINQIESALDGLKAGKEKVHKSIEIGKALFDASTKHYEILSNIVVYKVLTKSQVRKYLHLIMNKDGIKSYDEMLKANHKPEILASHKDENVYQITEESLSRTKKPSIRKFMNMKGIDTPRFEKILDGVESEYLNFLAEKKTEAEKATHKIVAPVFGITGKEYQTLIKGIKENPKEHFKEVVELKETIATLRKNNEELKGENDILQELYTGEVEERIITEMALKKNMAINERIFKAKEEMSLSD